MELPFPFVFTTPIVEGNAIIFWLLSNMAVYGDSAYIYFYMDMNLLCFRQWSYLVFYIADKT